MGFIELLVLAIGLSMDAFAVAICKGLATGNVKLKHMTVTGLWFGGFQALMPFIGFFLGDVFGKYVTSIDHWIAFILLGAIGANMVKESLSKEEETNECNDCFAFKTMLVMAVATSIDAFAAGITISVKNGNIFTAIILIGVTTFLFSAFGVKFGSISGEKYKSKAECFGGIVLILLGLKILLEDLGVIKF